MRQFLQFLFAGLITLLLIASPIAYKRWHDKDYRNFHVVQEGVLYRSGQLPLPRLQQIVTTHGIRTVICLRDGTDPVDQEEESWVKWKALKFVRIPPRTWYPDEMGKVHGEVSLQTFREVMDDPANYPVLVHCFAGIHRTGIMCSIFRIDYQNWTNAEAMAEMRMMGYSILDDHEDVLGFLTKYRTQPSAKRARPPILPASRQIESRP